MKYNILIAITLTISIIAIGFSALHYLRPEPQNPVGSLFVEENAYTEVATYSTNTLNSGAELVLSAATSTRTYCEICHSPTNNTLDPVFLFKQGSASGVVVNSGKAIFATSSIESSCMRIDADDPYLGAVFAISSASTTVTIECVQ